MAGTAFGAICVAPGLTVACGNTPAETVAFGATAAVVDLPPDSKVVAVTTFAGGTRAKGIVELVVANTAGGGSVAAIGAPPLAGINAMSAVGLTKGKGALGAAINGEGGTTAFGIVVVEMPLKPGNKESGVKTAGGAVVVFGLKRSGVLGAIMPFAVVTPGRGVSVTPSDKGGITATGVVCEATVDSGAAALLSGALNVALGASQSVNFSGAAFARS